MKLLINDFDEKEFFLKKKKIMTQKIMNIFNKIDLTSDDIKILIGIFKALKKEVNKFDISNLISIFTYNMTRILKSNIK